MEKPTAKEMVEMLSDFANNYSCPEKEFAELVMRDHRTIQQSIFRIFLKTIKMWSEEDCWDLRNEFTVKTSKKIMELLEGYDHVPMI